MAKISKEEIEHLARLARIHITKKEKKQYSKEISGVLGYVNKLNHVDTKNIGETSQTTGLENVYRQDKITDEWKVSKDKNKNRQKLLANAAQKYGDYIKVKQILN